MSVALKTIQAEVDPTPQKRMPKGAGVAPQPGALIINADDWGRDRDVSDRTWECLAAQTVSSVSAMVFMEDSERAAGIARAKRIDAGLHLNLTTAFTSRSVPAKLRENQDRIIQWLKGSRLAQTVFNPLLTSAFAYGVSAQIDEFERLYGSKPRRIDGHHHMHLCANVLFQGLLPSGTVLRRNYTFRPHEKSWLNRSYRNLQDRWLARRHPLSDYFLSLPPLEPVERLKGIFNLARHSVVELECHPINPEEHVFLTEGGLLKMLGEQKVAASYEVA